MSTSARLQIGAALGALVLVSLLVARTSSAAFTASTSEGPTTWSAATLSLTDNDSLVFTSNADVVPGYSETQCVEVTYDGTADSAGVELYAEVTGADGGSDGTDLGDHLQVEVVMGGALDDCTALLSSITGTTVFTQATMNGFNTSASPIATGWAPTGGAPQTRAFWFTVDLPTSVGNEAQGDDVTATFTWQTQNA